MVSKGKYPKEGIQRMAFIVIYSAHGIRVHESKGYSDRIGNTGINDIESPFPYPFRYGKIGK